MTEKRFTFVRSHSHYRRGWWTSHDFQPPSRWRSHTIIRHRDDGFLVIPIGILFDLRNKHTMPYGGCACFSMNGLYFSCQGHGGFPRERQGDFSTDPLTNGTFAHSWCLQSRVQKLPPPPSSSYKVEYFCECPRGTCRVRTTRWSGSLAAG